MKSSGGYTVRGNKIYVYGVVDGERYRLSTNKIANSINLDWVKENYRDVLLKLIYEKNNSKKIPNNFRTFAYEVLNNTSHKRDANTNKDYISKLERLIFPYFRSYKLEDIKPFDVEKWQNVLLKQYSTTTVRRTSNILGMVLKKAVANDMISKNPVEFAEKVQIRNKKQRPYSLDEMLKIMSSATGWLKVYLHLAFSTGMRHGELIGLQWSDVDFEKRIVSLKRSISHGSIKLDTLTKNHERTIIVPDFALAMLKELKKSSQSDWIFVSRLNQPYSDSKAIMRRHFKPLLKRIGVEFRTLKATRHTYISIMRNDGVDVNLVTEIAGHSKEVSDKYYFTSSINDRKIEVVNSCFSKYGF